MEDSASKQAGLETGAVQVEVVRMDETGGAVRVRVLVDASRETIWGIIGNCQQAFRYLAGMEACEVLVDEPAHALTHHVVDPGWFAPTLDYQFSTARAPFERMDIELVEGNLRAIEGYWMLSPSGKATVVEHELRIRPQRAAPRWLVRRKLERDLPRMMRCIRALSGGSLNEEAAETDLESCEDPRAHENQ